MSAGRLAFCQSSVSEVYQMFPERVSNIVVEEEILKSFMVTQDLQLKHKAQSLLFK